MTESLEKLLEIHEGHSGLAKHLLEQETHNCLEMDFVKAVNSYFTSDNIRILRTSEKVPEITGYVAQEGIREKLLTPVGANINITYDSEEIYPKIKTALEEQSIENKLKTLQLDFTFELSKIINIDEHILLIHDFEFFSDLDSRIGGLAFGNKHIAIVQSARYIKGRFRDGRYTLTEPNQREEYFKRLCAHEVAHLIFNMHDLTPENHTDYLIPSNDNCLSISQYPDNAEFCNGCLQTFRLYQEAKKLKTKQFEPYVPDFKK